VTGIRYCLEKAGRRRVLSEFNPISGCDNAARKADVVFVHGMGGDAFGTWRHGEGDANSWPHWLGEEFGEAGVWSLGYAASASKWGRIVSKGEPDAGHSMALPDRALEVLDRMVQRGLGERPLLFIGHSLGGLLIKQVLRTSAEAAEERKRNVFANTRAVLFVATPHAGAGLATTLNIWKAVIGTTVTIE